MNKTLILAVSLACAMSYYMGSVRTAAHYKAKEVKTALATQSALTQATQAARERELALNKSLLAQSERLAMEQNNADKSLSQLRSNIQSGAVRLSIATRSDRAACGATAALADQSGAEARADIVPSVADELVSIAADGDAAVRQLNALIDYYNANLNACSTGK